MSKTNQYGGETQRWVVCCKVRRWKVESVVCLRISPFYSCTLVSSCGAGCKFGFRIENEKSRHNNEMKSWMFMGKRSLLLLFLFTSSTPRNPSNITRRFYRWTDAYVNRMITVDFFFAWSSFMHFLFYSSVKCSEGTEVSRRMHYQDQNGIIWSKKRIITDQIGKRRRAWKEKYLPVWAYMTDNSNNGGTGKEKHSWLGSERSAYKWLENEWR